MTTGWGKGGWGSTQWGLGTEPPPPEPPVITPLGPLEDETNVATLRPISIRFTDVIGVSPSRAKISVNGVNWVIGGVGVNGAVATYALNGLHGFDMRVVPPAPYGIGDRQEVQVSVDNVVGMSTSLVYAFYVGIGVRLVSVINPFENVLLAYFNRPMRRDGAFFNPASWKISAVSPGALPLSIVAVYANDAQADMAHLKFEGGGSIYALTVGPLESQDGDTIEFGYNSQQFEIMFGDEEVPTIRLFNSVFGPLGIRQRTRRRRSMDDHVANRAIAAALDEQFRLRLQRFDGTAGRDGRPGGSRI